ncbi:hypothetical protein AYO21_05349 [Fonsecaea monophora]|uniref:ferric-chelate reductase (NADPH) n=1 Tax=Fonsecaea monophora TaxID=254056 RepID=A0A177FB34_9EURO|nr:hypothetical protein AYO21_05349 [Fonsecaea monophora]OAG40449.1 hypothetical protein AYO21_05349 [Fonsecaea monophora]
MDDAASPEECLDILRLSLKSSDSLVALLAESSGVPSPDHLRKIIAAILWHRKFIVTYYLWIVGAIVIVGGVHCGRAAHQRKRWDKNDQRHINYAGVAPNPSPSSSGTSTGTITPSQKEDCLDNGETTPLLSRSYPTSRRRPPLGDRLKSLLMFQPRPISALTAPSNVLPNNAITLAILFFLAVNLFYLFYRAPLSLPWIFILADRAGLLFLVNLPVLYFLAAKNNQPLKCLTGHSYEGLNIFHRRLGEWMTCFAVIHMFGMLAVWYTILRSLGWNLLRYMTSRVVFLGFCAVISYYLIYLTSIGWFRRLYYESFLVVHVIFQFAALVFLFFHYPTAQPYVCAAFAVWAVDRLLWRMTISSRKFIATLEVAPDGDTVLVHCNIPLSRQNLLLGVQTNLYRGWSPGQHVFLTIPSMGFKYRFQAHPFTIASPAPAGSLASGGSWPLQLTIRAIDGFSLDLLRHARHHQHCEVVLDGPYGSTSALHAAQSADRVCFVAGGSGIAVTYPLSWAVRVRQDSSADAGLFLSTRTTYENGVKTMPSTAAESAPADGDPDYAHFWVRQEVLHGKWICMVPRASAVKSLHDDEDVQDSATRPVGPEQGDDEAGSLVTRAFDTRSPGCQHVRPDMQSEIYSWITSVSSSSLANAAGKPLYPSSSSSSSSSSTILEDCSPDPLPSSSSSSSSQSALQTPKLNFKVTNESIPSQADKQSTADRTREKICIIVSGPDGLVRDVRNIAADLVRQGGWDIDVWAEKFGW